VSPIALAAGDGEPPQTRNDRSMHYVYIIRSIQVPSERYIGVTHDVEQRLAKHNSGGSPHTAKFIPWNLETTVGFSDKAKAHAFERYLKTGSGFAFAKKHF